ncbi:hypothetical protein AC1031_004546 [Aphanomyces cochlioides]|nr:hypothetical protein AC1031_004546 [Aphanomyces cochlioides]
MNKEDFKCYREITSFVKASRPAALTREERLDILRLFAHYRNNNVSGATEKVSKALGRSETTVKEVWRTYKSLGSVVVSPPPGNTSNHKTVFPHTKLVTNLVEEFVRRKRLRRERVVAKDVVALLNEKGNTLINIFIITYLTFVKDY